MAYRRRQMGAWQRARQARAPQPDRDLPMGQKPMSVASQFLAKRPGTQTITGSLGGAMNAPTTPGGFGGWGGFQRPAGPPQLGGKLGGTINVPIGNNPDLYPPKGGGGNQQGGLPLSGEFEQMRRGLDDALSAQLAAIGVQRERIPAMVALITQRLATDETESLRQTDESANERGIYNSGIRTTDRGKVNLGYTRQRQDLASDVARQYEELAMQEAQARMLYQQQIMDSLLGLSDQWANDPYAPIAVDEPSDGPGRGGGKQGGGKQGGGSQGGGKKKKKKKKKGKGKTTSGSVRGAMNVPIARPSPFGRGGWGG